MPMTKKMRHELLAVLSAMERAQTFIADSSVAVCRIDNVATTTLHYTRAYVPNLDRSPADAKPLFRIAKDIGSDLCGLSDAIRNLKRVLES